jgi:succinyl-CoA synthetase beta subunit
MDEPLGRPVVLASLHGGVDVERAPAPPARVTVDPRRGLFSHEATGLWRAAGLRGLALRGAAEVLVGLYRVFAQSDALLVEVNPLMPGGEEPPVAVDARVIVDDNGLFRHPRWREALLADPSGHPLERRAASLGITYVDLEGDIAVISGGAGATMALLDAIEHYGGRPANFLDTAGGSGPDTMRHMVDLVLEKAATDERVRAIVLNVTIAGTPLESFVRGAVAALNERPPRVPIFGCVRAAAAATQAMSLAEGTAILEAHGVQLFPDLRRAVVVAVGHAREDR